MGLSLKPGLTQPSLEDFNIQGLVSKSKHNSSGSGFKERTKEIEPFLLFKCVSIYLFGTSIVGTVV